MNRLVNFFEKFYEKNDEQKFNLLIEGKGFELWYHNLLISDIELLDDCIVFNKDTSTITFDIYDVECDEVNAYCKNDNLSLTISIGNLF